MTCENDPLTLGVPFFPYTPTAQPDTVQQIDVTFKNNGTHNLFYMDNSTFRGDFNDPVLLDAKLGNLDFPAHYNVYNFGNSTSIRFVVYNHAPAGSHPMHMHGHDFSVLATGSGTWDGTVTNPLNPVRRDVFILPIAVSPTVPSYVVFQIEADNPGTWPFHCHIAWHISTGLYINILERPADIQKDMAIPSIMAQTCRDWWAWTGNNVVDQIDSGL
jgi:FtsP/CotA-like multicopper oxidase with cupredoxin domain